MYRAWDWPLHEEGLDWAETPGGSRSTMSSASDLVMESLRGRLTGGLAGDWPYKCFFTIMFACSVLVCDRSASTVSNFNGKRP